MAAKFVSYWMTRFQSLNDERIFISYERLTSDEFGTNEAKRITRFLGQSQGVYPIDLDSVGCVWQAVVKYKDSAPSPEAPSSGGDGNVGQRRLGETPRRRLDPAHHDSQRSGPTELPYTPELLSKMSDMLLELIDQWGDSHLRLKITLEGYQQAVHEAFLQSSGPSGQSGLHPSNIVIRKNFHIIQASMPHTGSTIINNLLMGLFDKPDADYAYINDSPEIPVRQRGVMVPIDSMVVTQTNIVDLLNLYKKFRLQFDEVFFVVSNRGDERVDEELCDYTNVMCVEYDDLIYTNKEELISTVQRLTAQFRHNFYYYFSNSPELLDESKQLNAVKRLEAMNEAKPALEQEQYNVRDDKFGIHGHRDLNINALSQGMPLEFPKWGRK